LADNLLKTIGNFLLPSEISEAKRKVIACFFDGYLTECPFKVIRRIFNLLDNIGVLGAYQFADVNLDRLPKYGPEELSICSIADRQFRLDYDVKVLARSVTDARLSVNYSNRFELHMATLQEHVNKLSAVCGKVSSFSDMLQRSRAMTLIGAPQRQICKS
jgi:hypothetical protein